MKIYKNSKIIKGGVAERKFKDRLDRLKGAQYCWGMQRKEGFTWFYDNEFKIKKIRPIPTISWFYEMGLTGECEIGYRRVPQLLFSLLLKENKVFSENYMQKCLDDLSSFEFGVSPENHSNDLEILEGKCSFGLAPPHLPEVFSIWEKERDK